MWADPGSSLISVSIHTAQYFVQGTRVLKQDQVNEQLEQGLREVVDQLSQNTLGGKSNTRECPWLRGLE